MFNYIVRRLLLLIPILIGVSLVVFLFIQMVPGDPARIMLGEHASPEALAELREQMGLNDPVHVQYLRFASRLVRGDLGRSITSKNRVWDELLARFPATLELSIAAMIIAMLIGIPAGVISATRQNSLFDRGSMFLALLGVSMPVFWLGLMLIWLFSLVLGWLPASARLDSIMDVPVYTRLIAIDSLIAGDFAAFGNSLLHLILPGLTLGTIPMAIIARMTRSSLLEVMSQDYIRTARAKGLIERRVIMRHGLRNALIPVITVIGLEFGALLGGAVMTETIFSWPGIGRLTYDAIMNRDFPLLQGCILLIALSFVFVNLVVDVAYAYFDPRIHYD